MTNNNSFLYTVVLSGKIKTGFDVSQVANQVALLFKISSEKASLWFSGEPTIIKRNITHKQAYSYQLQLEECGAEVVLTKTPTPKVETTFTMVPNGEELTPFEELKERLTSGELVECNHCNKQQALSAYCGECGKPLFAKIVKQDEITNNKSSKLKWVGIIISLITVLLLVLFSLELTGISNIF